ncbi:hypothetical protein M0802_005852 [Mischocyttarus mexicanus]|nr:hypothetical protein M0802_005852 [Mischocyttarus mexicanus]
MATERDFNDGPGRYGDGDGDGGGGGGGGLPVPSGLTFGSCAVVVDRCLRILIKHEEEEEEEVGGRRRKEEVLIKLEEICCALRNEELTVSRRVLAWIFLEDRKRTLLVMKGP